MNLSDRGNRASAVRGGDAWSRWCEFRNWMGWRDLREVGSPYDGRMVGKHPMSRLGKELLKRNRGGRRR